MKNLLIIIKDSLLTVISLIFMLSIFFLPVTVMYYLERFLTPKIGIIPSLLLTTVGGLSCYGILKVFKPTTSDSTNSAASDK